MGMSVLFLPRHIRDMLDMVSDHAHVGLSRIMHEGRIKVDLKTVSLVRYSVHSKDIKKRNKRKESYHDNTVLLTLAFVPNLPQHTVWDIPGDISKCAGGGMAPHHRRAGHTDRFECSGIRSV